MKPRSPRSTPRRGAVAKAARCAVLEALEVRQFLSVSVDDGKLSVVGTSGDDVISVSRDAKRPGALVVSDNGYASYVDAGRITAISINGLEGNDRLVVDQGSGAIAIPVALSGGAGNDTLGGGDGADVLIGGRGNDLIRAGGGRDALEGHAGNDTLYGGLGRDTLRGNGGADLFYTGGESDRTDAGSDDRLDANIPSATHGPRNRGGSARPAIDNTYDSSDGYGPDQIRKAYGLGAVGDASFTNRGAGQTIAIVAAYDAPTIRQDLQAYSAEFGLPAISRDNFQVYYATKKRPVLDVGWAGEAALDVEMAHAIAPDAKIIVVEAASSSGPDLDQAIEKAAQLLTPTGGVISMSFGLNELFSGDSEALYGSFPANISLVAATGDSGAEVNYPAASEFVTAVGGTVLPLDASGNRTGPETGWAGSGGGVSSFFVRPGFQAGTTVGGLDWGGTRAVPDLSFVASPSTGVANYFTAAANPGDEVGWDSVGGTSAAAPGIAGFVALINERRDDNGLGPIGNTLNQAIYRAARRDYAANFIDIDSGSNGYAARTGYDLVTGWGSPNGTTFIDTLAADDTAAASDLSFEGARVVLRTEDTGRRQRALLFGGSGFGSADGSELLLDLVPNGASGVSLLTPTPLQANRKGTYTGDGEIRVQLDATSSVAYRTRFVAHIERRNRRNYIVGEFYAVNRRGNVIYTNDKPLLYGTFAG